MFPQAIQLKGVCGSRFKLASEFNSSFRYVSNSGSEEKKYKRVLLFLGLKTKNQTKKKLLKSNHIVATCNRT